MKNIEILRIISLRGPNIWTYRPALEAWIDIGELEECPSNLIPGFNERLTALLPSLIEHRCSVGERGGFIQRLETGTWPGHILEHVTLELQNLAGLHAGFGKARETSKRGVYKVVVRARHETITRAALYAARDLVMATIENKPYDVAATVGTLRAMVDSLCLGPSTACIVKAATERHIPNIRLSAGNLVQLGYGASQRRIWTAETDQTSAIAESISRDKDLTKSLLQACGVPIPEGRTVDSAADAWDAAQDIGLPVVIKPTDGNHGRGVFIDLNTQAEIEKAYANAEQQGNGVIVERFVRGNEHRLLIVGGKLAAAAAGEPVAVIGDGSSTITALVHSQLNSDPRRGESEEHPLNPVQINDDPSIDMELERQGYTSDSIPATGKHVLIQRNGNVANDVTEQVHPSIAAAASLAARIVGLDIAGVDLVVEDISKPLEQQGGAIVEVNSGPGLLMHLKPAAGNVQPIGNAIIDHLFKSEAIKGENGDAAHGRIPIVGVTGTHGKTVVSHLIATLLNLSGKHTGLACGDGLYYANQRVEKGDCANWAAAHRVLLNRAVEAAVFENGSTTILAEGLAYDRCQVGVVTNIAPDDSLPEYYIDDAEHMARVLRTQVDIVLSGGIAVLNAADPLVADMAALCDGEVIFFGVEQTLPVLDYHLEQGKRAVFVRHGQIMLAAGKNEIMLAQVAAIPLTADGQPPFQTENVLAAVAAAWALDISINLIRAGIETFHEAAHRTSNKTRKQA